MSSHSYSPDYRQHQGKPQTIAAGVVLSLFLHAGLFHFFKAPAPYRAAPDEQPGAPYSIVWMAPPKVAQVLPQRVPEVTRAAPARPAPAQRAAGRAAKAPIATAATASLLPEPITAPLPTQPPPDAAAEAGAPPKFDVNAALKSARKFATERARPGDPPVAQLQDKPINELRSESQLARNIQQASRADCKDVARGTGILALVVVPYLVLTDKKDSGCKW